MGSVDILLARKEKRAAKRCEKRKRQRQKAEDDANLSMVELVSSEDETTEEARGDEVTPTKNMRTNITDRDAVFVLSAAAHSLGHDVTKMNINRSTIQRQRQKHRANVCVELKEELSGDSTLIVHWDGKLMQDLTSKAKIDRLPILVSGNGAVQLLNVPKLSHGTGYEMAKEVVKALEDWGLSERIGGMSFDTTSSNTGRINGACVLIEQQLKKDLLYFACRHHIHELLLGEVFRMVMGPMSGPNVSIFKRFQDHWQSIDQSQFESGASHPDVCPLLDPVDKAWFESTLINCKSLRDDYRELLELTLIFLGQVPPRGVWMFRGQFKLTAREEKGLRQIAIFVSCLYAKAWTLAPEAVAAPRHDLQLLKDLTMYMNNVNEDVGRAVLNKLQGHLWYLSEELVALALFDPLVRVEDKRKILTSLHTKEGEKYPVKRPKLLPSQSITGLGLQDMASTNTRRFFQKLRLEEGFLDADPATWLELEDYQTAAAFVQRIAVINDHAERGVALIQEYNRKLTRDEDQLQFLLQNVSQHRKEFPDTRKMTIVAGLAAKEEKEHQDG
ncbi:Uncharacterized protein FKW44_018816 [Caligus rogercresseyi]|uniref:Uncharacterized protein n=1 Tax=Caligus rogercresseyi TaxID=217165 RepID=A0A7T8GVL6_CALRO|nr:Uncharacterized protein FKW44_018816 [Caligus rogercresseyi]